MTPEDVARALDDPDDMVRAAAVHAAARTGRAGLRLLVP